MFTGIIEAIGSIRAMTPKGGDVRVYVATGKLDLGDVKLGDSIAVNGVCLTAVELPGDGFWADVSRETLAHTAFISLKAGSKVNLEKALRPQDRLGGHIVSGHVDGIGQVTHFGQVGESWELRVMAPPELGKYLAYKGSITVNGVSLTVNRVADSAQGCEFSINLIPHTVENTTLGTLQAGSAVNLEIDTVARYVERMLASGANFLKDPA